METCNRGHQLNKMSSALFNIDFAASISLTFIAWHVPCDVSVLQRCHSWHSSLECTNRTPQNGTKTAKQDNIPEASFNKKYSAALYTVSSTWMGDTMCRELRGGTFLSCSRCILTFIKGKRLPFKRGTCLIFLHSHCNELHCTYCTYDGYREHRGETPSPTGVGHKKNLKYFGWRLQMSQFLR